jgi:stage II sporulation protein E
MLDRKDGRLAHRGSRKGRRVAARWKELAAESRIAKSLAAARWQLSLSVMGFLLGRALLFSELSPFATALFAAVFFLRRESLYWTGMAIAAGGFFAEVPHGFTLAGQLVVCHSLLRGLELFDRSEPNRAPLAVFFSVFAVGLFVSSMETGLSWFGLVMTTVEACLSFVLAHIFMLALPALAAAGRRTVKLRNEEIVCLMILLASLLTGTVGWSYGGVTAPNVLSHWLIASFAFSGGAPIGAAAGAVTGLILSLADPGALQQIGVLAFAGLLAGLFREGGRIGVVAGLVIGSLLLVMYTGEQGDVAVRLAEAGLASLFFLLTPSALVGLLARFVPGTRDYVKSQHEYARRVRDITAGRVEQFSEVFRQLSASFQPMDADEPSDAAGREELAAHFMNEVARKACTNCYKYRQCWEDKFYRTYTYMTDMMTAVEQNPAIGREDIRGDWKQMCVQTEKVLELMKHQYELHNNDLRWRKQLQDSRRLVADQLHGVSQVMMDLAREIKREGQEMHRQEEQIRAALEQLGLSVQEVDIICLDEGKVEIEIVHNFTGGHEECRKVIAPLLSDILGENIVVQREEAPPGGKGFSTAVFVSAKAFEVETGFACAAKGGGLLSGDSFTLTELRNGKFVVALSDGMGNGERAKMESGSALSILEQLLQSGMDERLAVKSVNSILLLRSADEMFTTIDLALIDLYTAKTTFLKSGSTPSFIKRGKEVIPVAAGNLPAGILQDIEIDAVTVALKPGDILVLMTDGIYDAPGPTVNKELWMRRILSGIEAESPQDIADCLLESVIRRHGGEILDDMTVVVARIDRYVPEWATVRWRGKTEIERPKSISS